MYLLWRLRGRKIKDPNLPPRWGLLYLFALIAGLSHIVLDFTNGYGVRPFWPFSERWYSWDIVFIIDPIIYALLLAGLVVPALFSLIDREIGVRRRGPGGQRLELRDLRPLGVSRPANEARGFDRPMHTAYIRIT